MAQLTASDMTRRMGPGGHEWRVPHSSQSVSGLQVDRSARFSFYISILAVIRLSESGLGLLWSFYTTSL